jgi:hypothetical protein
VAVLLRLVGALVWVLVAALIAFGGAGVVAAMNHVPGTDARPELTWAADAAAKAQLDAATDRLQTLSAEVDTLGSYARQALAAVVAGDRGQTTDLITAGTNQLATVSAAAASLQQAIDAVDGPGPGSDLRISPEVQDRFDGLAATPSMTSTLADDWATFTGKALDAVTLTGLLAEHDQDTAEAAQQGAQAKYPEALARLDASDATMARITGLRDRLSKTTDVSTLDQWIERVGGYDKALRNLYEVLVKANGKVTNKVRAAFDGEQAARRRLPPDAKPLLVILADVAQGGLNQAAISIEETRASLADALDIQRQLQQDVNIALPE